MKLRALLLFLLAVPLLAGCQIEPAAYLIDGGNHSLTVERRKAYFWSSGWELNLVVARFPDCQRRYALKKSGEKVFVYLFRVQPGVFILKQGQRWYVAETSECRFQQYEQEPPLPGELLGSFRVKNGEFGFVPAEDVSREASEKAKKSNDE